MLSDRSDLAFQPGSSGHISDHMNRHLLLIIIALPGSNPSHKRGWSWAMGIKQTKGWIKQMFSLMRQNLWIKLFQRLVSLGAPLKFKISGCPWIQTSPRTSRKRRRDSYLRWVYIFYTFLHFSSKWDGPKTSFSLTPSYVCSTPAWENIRNKIHTFNCEQSFEFWGRGQIH